MTSNDPLDDLMEEAVSSRPTLAHENPLEDLYTEALLQRKQRVRRQDNDPALKQSLDNAARKMKELYTKPENWTRTRGIALIDADSKVLVGNFSEYIHNKFPSTRKLLREHLPIAIDAAEECSGYIGTRMEEALRGRSWEVEHRIKAHVRLDELGLDCPDVQLNIQMRLGAPVAARLAEDTQFASHLGNTLLMLPAGTDILFAASVDTKTNLRKALS
jgi:hypothetical protein